MGKHLSYPDLRARAIKDWGTEYGATSVKDGIRRARKPDRVLVDAKAMMFLLGTEMDYQQSVLKSGFVFNNPNQVSACGCGESVQLKPAAAS